MLIIAVLFVTTPAFRNANNFTQIPLSASVYMMLLWEMTFAIIIGGIDLSVGSIVGLASGVTCMAMVSAGLPLWLHYCVEFLQELYVVSLMGCW